MARRLTEESPDAAWLDAEAERRREAFELERTQHAQARLLKRQSQPLGRRFADVVNGLATLSTAKNQSWDPKKSGMGYDSAPPGYADALAVGGVDRQEVARLLAIVERSVGELEAITCR